MIGRISVYPLRRRAAAGVAMLAIATAELLGASSTAQAAQTQKPKPCAILKPTVQPLSVDAALKNSFSTLKPTASFRITAIQERSTKAGSGQCEFTATLVPARGHSLHKTIWVFSPYSAGTKKFPHPNLVLPGLFGNETGDTLAGVIVGYGGFNESSKAGHPTSAEAAALDALALRWATSHRLEGGTSTTTTS